MLHDQVNRGDEGVLHAHPNPILGELTTEVGEAVGAMQSATVLISGFSAKLQMAIEAALDNGATAAELAPLSDLKSSLDTAGNDLAAAVAANS
jgi:hypothetical protein